MSAQQAAATRTLRFAGRSRFGIYRWEYVPFDVAPGVRRITVTAGYQPFTIAGGRFGNVLDLGLFGPQGWGVDGSAGLRGWSGGARSSFTVSAVDATPGYLPGPIDAGTWAVALGPVVMHPMGMRWWVRVDLEYGDALLAAVDTPPPAGVPGCGAGWYRGDLHLHTVHSDGRRTPAELVAAARAAGLDFVASTEHNTNAANRAWGAEELGGLLVIPGEEVTTRHGHWLGVGLPAGEWVDWRYAPRDRVFGRHAGRVREAGGMVVAAHPMLPVPGCAWEFGYRHVDAIEVWNGRWTPDDEASLTVWNRMLRRGRRVAAVGGSDSHAPDDPVGRPQVAVHADRLSAAAVVDGLVAGRSYLAESAQVGLALQARHGTGTAGPGEEIDTPAEVTATVSGAPDASLVVRTAAGPAATARTDSRGDGGVCVPAPDPADRFVRVEVRRRRNRGEIRGAMVAMSNPIWLRRP